jgi:hypothetical protein
MYYSRRAATRRQGDKASGRQGIKASGQVFSYDVLKLHDTEEQDHYWESEKLYLTLGEGPKYFGPVLENTIMTLSFI